MDCVGRGVLMIAVVGDVEEIVYPGESFEGAM